MSRAGRCRYSATGTCPAANSARACAVTVCPECEHEQTRIAPERKQVKP